jgi:hypothetical protein
MASEQQPKRSEIDYSNPPADLAYVALSDIRAAYAQGRADMAAELDERVTQLQADVRRKSEDLNRETRERLFGIPHDMY